jgi:hypothetical protein
VGMGELRKETAEYFVKLHNETYGGDKQWQTINNKLNHFGKGFGWDGCHFIFYLN